MKSIRVCINEAACWPALSGRLLALKFNKTRAPCQLLGSGSAPGGAPRQLSRPCPRQPDSLVQQTGYTLESLKPCLLDLHQTYLGAPQHAQQSVREKYKHPK